MHVSWHIRDSVSRVAEGACLLVLLGEGLQGSYCRHFQQAGRLCCADRHIKHTCVFGNYLKKYR
jgi:hypothetical protein